MKFPSSEQWLYLFNMLVSRWINSGKDISKYYPPEILCIKWDEIGDMVTATHVFSLLKKRFPKSEIHVITKPYSAGVLENNPNIDKISTDLNAWNKRYSMVVELRGTWKTLWKSFRYYPAVRLDRGSVRIRQRGNQPHETVTNFRIIEPVLNEIGFESPSIYPGEINRARIKSFCTENNLDKYCIIHAGARSTLRRWNSDSYAGIADWLFKDKNLKIVFTGTADEEIQIKEITDKMHENFTLFTRNMNLADLAALMESATLFIGNESGPLQMADALNIPSLGLFGPGVPNVFYPQNSKSAIIHHILECNPCDQIHCVHPENPCINRITTAEVKEEIEKILS